MGILTGKTVFVTGIYRNSSIAYRCAELALQEGARVIASGFGRRSKVTRATVRSLGVPVADFDATVPEDADTLAGRLAEHTDRIDGVVHCISQSWPSVVGDFFMDASWEDVSHSFQVSAYSYVALARACLPLMGPGSAFVGCTVDAERAWPLYGWAGVAKAAYESENRYLAHHLGKRGIRANLVAAGPVETFTMREVAGVQDGLDAFKGTPLAWDPSDSTPVARTMLALLSDWAPATTGEVIRCDGGHHAVGY